ncbi:hypothetical protein GDO81_008153 [Engystomops pustulosus]|uniref:SOGA 1/2-like coiled-coil domain-containing protein n=1 Tax=Engystomops pustulosus TaxID=76066 RepID=A0AAV7CDC2_ENGPU|nr:hypothetical protein GDO81_008153 [Engystomops pustulosus]
MWNENENTPELCHCQRYQGRYGTCHLSGSSNKGKGRDRSRSPFKYSATKEHPYSACQDNTLGLCEQNLLLKKKCDDLRRRHRKEREVWRKEKEGLLKEVIDLKAGENRGILLELKAVLEVIQKEQRREEKKWTDFLLQFLNDRCGWEIESIELKQNISKLEDNSTKTCASQSNLEDKDIKAEETDQKQLTEDTTAAVMELRTHLEKKEWNWKVEKMEMLERFDNERKEWECQWKTMQNKIEELYEEVKLRREMNLNGADDRLGEKMLQFSMPFSQAGPTKPTNIARQNDVVSIKPDRHDKEWLSDYSPTIKEKSEIKMPNQNHHINAEPEKSITQRMSKTENDTLNDALKEIARVSEELCKYQEEIRARANCKKVVSSSVVGEFRRNLHVKAGKNHTSCPKMSKNIQKDFWSNNKSAQESIFTAETSQLQEYGRSLENQVPASSLNFSWPLPNTLFQDKIPVTDENLVPISTQRLTTDIELNKIDSELCHLEWLCGIGGLEDGNFTESLFNSFTDINGFTPEMNKQNLAVSQNQLFNSDGLYPEVIMLGHSSVGSAYSYGNTIKNGKLAAKIDEFNRVVFKTGKGNAVSHDDVSMDMVLDIDEEHLSPPLSRHLSTGQAVTKPLTVTEPPCALSSSHNGATMEKTTAQLCQQTNGPLATCSYKNTLQKQNWKGINLSGRPRSADSRSNYGVVEKLLKSYETKVAAPVCNSKPSVSKWTQADFLLTDNSSERLTQCLEMLHLEQTAKVLQNDIHWYPHQDSLGLRLPEVSRTLSSEKGFSRPARPANRRPPSRWASTRSPSKPSSVRRATH